MINPRRVMCECGTRMEDGRCPLCAPLSQPHNKMRSTNKVLKDREKKSRERLFGIKDMNRALETVLRKSR